MRKAGFAMLAAGVVAFVLAILGLFGDKPTGDNVPFFQNSWMVIMAIFWTLAGLGVILTFGKDDTEIKKR